MGNYTPRCCSASDHGQQLQQSEVTHEDDVEFDFDQGMNTSFEKLTFLSFEKQASEASAYKSCDRSADRQRPSLRISLLTNGSTAAGEDNQSFIAAFPRQVSEFLQNPIELMRQVSTGCGGSANGSNGGPPADEDLAIYASFGSEVAVCRVDSEEHRKRLAFVRQVPLLARLPLDFQEMMSDSLVQVDFQPGATVFCQGDIADGFFLICQGKANVLISDGKDSTPRLVAILGDGSYFGEKALLCDVPRTATVMAESALSCYTISRERFQELGLDEALEFPKSAALGFDSKKKVLVKPPCPKTKEERKLFSEALHANTKLTEVFSNLGENHMDQMIDVAWKENVDSGDVLCVEGDNDAHFFFIVRSGSFEVCTKNTKESEKKAWKMGKRGSYGELSLLCQAPSDATVRALEASSVWVIARPSFHEILQNISKEAIAKYAK